MFLRLQTEKLHVQIDQYVNSFFEKIAHSEKAVAVLEILLEEWQLAHWFSKWDPPEKKTALVYGGTSKWNVKKKQK